MYWVFSQTTLTGSFSIWGGRQEFDGLLGYCGTKDVGMPINEL